MKALIVANVQNDLFNSDFNEFLGYDDAVSNINRLLPEFKLVIFTQYCFTEDSKVFELVRSSDKKYCLKGTPGADVYSKIKLENIKGSFYLFKQGLNPNFKPVSAFYDEEKHSIGLGEFLKDRGVEDVYITGRDENWSINNTAIDSLNFGFKTIIINDACSNSWKWNPEVLVNCFELGIDVIDTWEFNLYDTINKIKI